MQTAIGNIYKGGGGSEKRIIKVGSVAFENCPPIWSHVLLNLFSVTHVFDNSSNDKYEQVTFLKVPTGKNSIKTRVMN